MSIGGLISVVILVWGGSSHPPARVWKRRYWRTPQDCISKGWKIEGAIYLRALAVLVGGFCLALDIYPGLALEILEEKCPTWPVAALIFSLILIGPVFIRRNAFYHSMRLYNNQPAPVCLLCTHYSREHDEKAECVACMKGEGKPGFREKP